MTKVVWIVVALAVSLIALNMGFVAIGFPWPTMFVLFAFTGWNIYLVFRRKG